MSQFPPPPPAPPQPPGQPPRWGSGLTGLPAGMPPKQPPPGTWFARHKALSVGGGIFLSLIVIGALNSPKNKAKPATPSRAATSAVPRATNAPQSPSPTSGPVESPTATAPAVTSGTATAPSASTASRAPKRTEAPAGPTTTAPAPPPPAVSPQQVLQAAIIKKLGKSNRHGVQRVSTVEYAPDGQQVLVEWAANENITGGLTKDGLRLDVLRILEQIHKSGVPVKRAVLRATYSLQDKFGAVSEDRVLSASFSGETVGRIQYDAVDFKHIIDLADTALVIPAFQY